MTEESKARIKGIAKDIAVDLFRGLIVYLSFLLVYGILSALFINGCGGIAKEFNYNYQPFYIAVSLALPLPFFSLVRAFELYDKSAQAAFPFDSIKKYGFITGLRILFTTGPLLRKLLTQVAVIALFLLLFPYRLGYSFIVASFYPKGGAHPGDVALIILGILLPVLIILTILAKCSAHKWWIISPSDKQKAILTHKHPNIRTLLEGLKILAIYGISFPLLPAVIMMTISMVLTFGIFTLWMWIALIAFIILFIVIRILRAVLARRRYVKKLLATLKANGYTVSKIKRPILSVLRPLAGTDFTAERDGRVDSIKLMGHTNRKSPTFISPNGYVTVKKSISLLKMPLFYIMTDTDYRMEGENKIVIFTPMPRAVYINWGRTDIAPDDGEGAAEGGGAFMMGIMAGGGIKQRSRGSTVHGPGYVSDVDRGIIKPFETGERIGEYKFFTPEGFLSAVDNNCLDR